jgi:hypothetical protein
MRGAFRAMFVTLSGLIVGSFAQAQTSDTSAVCPGINGAKLPTQVTYDDGSVLTVIDRSAGKVHQEVTTANGRKFDAVDYQGLFVLTSDVPTGKERGQTGKLKQNWNQDLTQFFPLKVGEHILADGTTKNSVNDTVMNSLIEMTVWSRDRSHRGVRLSCLQNRCPQPISRWAGGRFHPLLSPSLHADAQARDYEDPLDAK